LKQGAYLVRKLEQRGRAGGLSYNQKESCHSSFRKFAINMISEPHRLGAQEGDLVEVKPLGSSARKITGKLPYLGSILNPNPIQSPFILMNCLEFSKSAIDRGQGKGSFLKKEKIYAIFLWLL
jgi:hypothetical protein